VIQDVHRGPEGRARLADVARAAGVSRQTVSNALNTPDRLRPDTLARVRQAIDELGYQPNRVARSLRLRASGQIGYRLDPGRSGTARAALDDFLHALAQAAQDAQHNLVIVTLDDDREELQAYADLMRAGGVDGFILSEVESDDVRPAWLLEHGIPFAAFGRSVDADRYSWVDVDGAAGTAAAVDHLVARGHEHIAFVGWPAGSMAGDARASGWADALRRHGLDPRSVVRVVERVDQGAVAARQLLDGRDPPTAIVAVSDTLAIGCLTAARERGLAVGGPAGRSGEALAIVGFDDSPTAALLTPSLTSVRQPLPEAGRALVAVLLDRVGHGPPRGQLLAPELVVRESS
jgi:DNA-binding LacI/PurR family transcriptional regulator